MALDQITQGNFNKTVKFKHRYIDNNVLVFRDKSLKEYNATPIPHYAQLIPINKYIKSVIQNNVCTLSLTNLPTYGDLFLPFNFFTNKSYTPDFKGSTNFDLYSAVVSVLAANINVYKVTTVDPAIYTDVTVFRINNIDYVVTGYLGTGTYDLTAPAQLTAFINEITTAFGDKGTITVNFTGTQLDITVITAEPNPPATPNTIGSALVKEDFTSQTINIPVTYSDQKLKKIYIDPKKAVNKVTPSLRTSKLLPSYERYNEAVNLKDYILDIVNLVSQ